MKPLPQSAFFACALLAAAALWPAPTSFCHAEEAEARAATKAAVAAAATPEYEALINDLFDRAATCEIIGIQKVLKRHSFDFTTPDAPSLQKLREIFLREQPRYLGTDIPASINLDYPFALRFLWRDKAGRTIGRLDLQERDQLIFDKTLLFTTRAAEAQTANETLLTGATDFACPELAAERRLPPPDYHAQITALFDKAATCKITGSYGGEQPVEVIDFSTSDPEELLDLKAIFLREKPRFIVNKEKPEVGEMSSENLYFTWLDAQGKEVGRVFLLEGDRVFFTGSHDLFTTTPADYPSGARNGTLRTLTGRYALPKLYPKPRLRQAEEAVKSKP